MVGVDDAARVILGHGDRDVVLDYATDTLRS